MAKLGPIDVSPIRTRLTNSLATKFVTCTTLIVVAAALCAFSINIRIDKVVDREAHVEHLTYMALNGAELVDLKKLNIKKVDSLFNDSQFENSAIIYAGLYKPLHSESSVLKGQKIYESEDSSLAENNRLKRFASYVMSKGDVQTLGFEDAIVIGAPTHANSVYLIVAEYVEPTFLWLLFSQRNLIILFVLIGISVPLTMLIGQRMLGPLQNLTQATALAAEGYLDIEFDTKSKDEIGILARSFQHMIENLRKTFTQINDLAFIDSITGLHSRQSMITQLTTAVENSVLSGATGVLFYIDLDGFKEVNDTYGHDKGDEVLREFASRLQQFFIAKGYILQNPGIYQNRNKIFTQGSDAEKVVLSRLGGDEFTVHINVIMSNDDAVEIADNLLLMLQEPFYINSRPATLGASIGMSFFPNDGESVTEVIKAADIAMYNAKESGKNTYRIYSSSMTEHVVERMEIGNDLREAIKNDDFIVYFQPLINAADHSLKSVEALVRWKHPEHGMISPGRFIPIAEEIGIIHEIGNIVLSESCRQSKEWLDSGFNVPIGVNVSNRQFEDKEFPNYVSSVLEQTGLPGNFLEIEITESCAMSGAETFVKSLDPLRSQGVKFAIDDFGTGFSNITQFMKMDFDTVKLDQSFVQKMRENKDARTIVATLLGMAKNLKIKTVAEGVETKDDLNILTRMGCDVIQGYYFARPMPADEFLFWLKQHNQSLISSRLINLENNSVSQLKIA